MGGSPVRRCLWASSNLTLLIQMSCSVMVEMTDPDVRISTLHGQSEF